MAATGILGYLATAATVAGTAYTVYSGEQQKQQQNQAKKQAKADSAAALANKPQAQKAPDANAIRKQNAQALLGGPPGSLGGTLLTGPSGAGAPGQTGANTLLGA